MIVFPRSTACEVRKHGTTRIYLEHVYVSLCAMLWKETDATRATKEHPELTRLLELTLYCECIKE